MDRAAIILIRVISIQASNLLLVVRHLIYGQ
jgi:hypothetical protein